MGIRVSLRTAAPHTRNSPEARWDGRRSRRVFPATGTFGEMRLRHFFLMRKHLVLHDGFNFNYFNVS